MASAPRSASSLPTCALTDSTRRRSIVCPPASSVCCSLARTSSAAVSACGGRRTSTSVSRPKSPRVNSETSDTIISSADNDSAIRRRPALRKSMLVLSLINRMLNP